MRITATQGEECREQGAWTAKGFIIRATKKTRTVKGEVDKLKRRPEFVRSIMIEEGHPGAVSQKKRRHPTSKRSSGWKSQWARVFVVPFVATGQEWGRVGGGVSFQERFAANDHPGDSTKGGIGSFKAEKGVTLKGE